MKKCIVSCGCGLQFPLSFGQLVQQWIRDIYSKSNDDQLIFTNILSMSDKVKKSFFAAVVTQILEEFYIEGDNSVRGSRSYCPNKINSLIPYLIKIITKIKIKI